MEEKQGLFFKIAYGCFYLGIVIEVLLVLIDKSAYINPVEGRLFQLTFLLFLIKVCLTRYTFKEYVTIFLFGMLGIVSYYMTGRNEVIRVIIFIAACKNIDMKKCLKLVFYMTLAGCIIIILLSVTGVYGAVSLTQEYRLNGIETRYTLGMGHPNALQCMVWALTTLGMYLYAEKLKLFHYGFALLINIFFFLLTDSKTSLLATTFTLILTYLLLNKKSENISKFSAGVSILLTVISIVGSVIIAGNAYRVYDYVWKWDRSPLTLFFMKLSDLLTGRIRILVENDTFEGTIQTWSLFSRPENNRFFDLGWVRLFYWYGIIPACAFIAVMLLVMLYCYSEKKYMAIMLITSFAIYTVIEAHGVSVYIARNYVFFLIGAYWSFLLKGKVLKKNEDRQ